MLENDIISSLVFSFSKADKCLAINIKRPITESLPKRFTYFRRISLNKRRYFHCSPIPYFFIWVAHQLKKCRNCFDILPSRKSKYNPETHSSILMIFEFNYIINVC